MERMIHKNANRGAVNPKEMQGGLHLARSERASLPDIGGFLISRMYVCLVEFLLIE